MCELGTDYRWVDVGVWDPAPAGQLYIAFGRYDVRKSVNNPAVKATWLDQIEFTREVPDETKGSSAVPTKIQPAAEPYAGRLI